MPDDQTALNFDARNRVLEKHQSKELVRWLEYRLWYWGSWMEKDGNGDFDPVSANDARQILAEEGIEVQEKRIFGGLFPPSRWQQVGWTNVKGPGHARRIGTFRPKPGVVFAEVARPDWLSR